MAVVGLFSRHQQSAVDGIELVDLRADRNFDHDQVRQVLDEALGHIHRAQAGFPELVNDHLRRVVALDSPIESASPLAEAFYTNFRASDRRNSFYLSCQLVWAATYVRLLRNRPWWRRRRYDAQARLAAKDAQLRFVQQFPDADYWMRVLNDGIE